MKRMIAAIVVALGLGLAMVCVAGEDECASQLVSTDRREVDVTKIAEVKMPPTTYKQGASVYRLSDSYGLSAVCFAVVASNGNITHFECH